jgi:SNF family Na+-dependent transporter
MYTRVSLLPGAFLIPFTIMLVIAGLPLMFMELSFGQYANLGPVAIYKKFCPLFRGLGYGMVIVSAIVMLYYNLIIAWTLFYMFASLNSVLPWQKCEEWSTVREYKRLLFRARIAMCIARSHGSLCCLQSYRLLYGIRERK